MSSKKIMHAEDKNRGRGDTKVDKMMGEGVRPSSVSNIGPAPP